MQPYVVYKYFEDDSLHTCVIRWQLDLPQIMAYSGLQTQNHRSAVSNSWFGAGKCVPRFNRQLGFFIEDATSSRSGSTQEGVLSCWKSLPFPTDMPGLWCL